MTEKPLSSEEVDNMLSDLARGLMDDSIKPAKAKEVNNALGKYIGKGTAQLQACINLGISMEIPVLGITDNVLSDRVNKQLK